MAPKVNTKKKKQAQVPPRKEGNVDRTVTWPDFPQKLVDVIAKQPFLMQSISYGGLTKLCISPPSKCYPNNSRPPCLQLLNETRINVDDEKNIEPDLNVSFYRSWFWPRPRYFFPRWERPEVSCRPRSFGKHLVGYSNDAIVTKGASFRDYGSSRGIYLSYLVEGCCYSKLPEWDERIPLLCVVKSSCSSTKFSNQNSTVMVLTGISRPAFVFCRERDWKREWVKQDCTLMEPHCSTKSEGKHFMTFTNVIGFGGKFYVLSLQGTLAVMEETDSYPPRITALSSERAVPSVLAKHFREYLLESEENILLVFLISRKSIKIVDEVEVFQLDTIKLIWVRMATLGDRTLFLGTNCCMSVSAGRLGCRKNSVYFNNQTADGWWVYDMEKGCISPAWTDVTTKSPAWTEPNGE